MLHPLWALLRDSILQGAASRLLCRVGWGGGESSLPPVYNPTQWSHLEPGIWLQPLFRVMNLLIAPLGMSSCPLTPCSTSFLSVVQWCCLAFARSLINTLLQDLAGVLAWLVSCQACGYLPAARTDCIAHTPGLPQQAVDVKRLDVLIQGLHHKPHSLDQCARVLY